MNRFRTIRRIPGLLLFAALVLRVPIPVGYMPAGDGHGLWFELCPEYAPEGLFTARNASRRESHTNHAERQAGQQPGDDEAQRGPFGHRRSPAAALDRGSASLLARGLPPAALPATAGIRAIRRHPPRSPAPPA